MTTEEARIARSIDEYQSPVSGYQLLLRLRIQNRPGMLGKVTTTIGEMGADIGSIDIAEASTDVIVRDFRIYCVDEENARRLVARVGQIEGIEVQHASDRTFQLHRRGKIETQNKVHIRTSAELSHVYTPGVARVSMQIHDNPDAVWSLTIKPNTVAVVTDGTAVLGLGDIGPEAAMPVMEGKSMLFKAFGDIDAWPICLDTKDPDEIVRIVKAISPGFGGILLEDISAPRCFDIEDQLKATLDIPVFHDDQHGTAVVVLAGLINSLKIVQKRPEDLKVVLLGVGAAGVACTKILLNFGVKNIIGFDRTGAIYEGRVEGMNPAKEWFAKATNREGFDGSISEAMQGADLFLGVSGPRMITADQVRSMNPNSIVMALSNPEPEIMPELIHDVSQARIIATGRSDYPNQVNNVLCFPGLFRGAFDAAATKITEEMKIVAARAIAETIPNSQLSEDYILPSVFNPEVSESVAAAVAAEAIRSGVVRSKGSRVFI
jgi:malate dehydrogenase (oxaloacetate-decarboxylating)